MQNNAPSEPLITVVIPTFNHAQFLKKAIQSVINQTYAHWEIIVVDNNSIDNTHEVLDSFSDSRITTLKVNNAGSIALSRNVGLVNAKGEWIAFLDSDDWWTPNKLTVCSRFFTKDNDLIYHNLGVSDSSVKGNTIKSRQVKSPVLLDLLLRGNTIATSSVVVRRSILDLISGMREDISLAGTEDYNTWLRISLLTEGFTRIPKILGFYRLHGENLSLKNAYLPPRIAIEEFLPILNIKNRRRVEANLNYVVGRLKYKSGNYSEARYEFEKTFHGGSLMIKLKIIWMLSICHILLFKQKF